MSTITNVSIRRVNGENGLVGFATVVINDCLALNDLRIVVREDKFFVNEPISKKYNNKEGKSVYPAVYHPITAEFRKALTDAVENEFMRQVLASYIE